MKKLLALALAVMLMLTALPAFADGEALPEWMTPYEEPVTVHVAVEEIQQAVFAEGESAYDNLWTRRWKELYNVEVIVDWSSSDYTTKLNLAMASNEMPDMFRCDATQYMQLEAADMLEPLNAAYEDPKSISPGLKSMMDKNWDIMEITMDDSGNILAMPQLHYGYECEPRHLWIRKDWAAAEGVTDETLKTIDDLTDLMARVKQNEGAEYGLHLYNNLNPFFWMCPAWHAAPKIWVEAEDGTLVYGSVQENMKPALEQFAAWYRDGYIRPDFASVTGTVANEDLFQGKVGIDMGANYYNPNKTIAENFGDDAWSQSFPLPSVDGEKVMYACVLPNTVWNVVRKGCEHPEVLTKLMSDYAYVLNEWPLDPNVPAEEILPFSTHHMHHVVGPFKVMFESYQDVKDVVKAFETGVEEFSSGYGRNYYLDIKQWTDNHEYVNLPRYTQMGYATASLMRGDFYVDNDQILKDKLWGAKPQVLIDYGSTLDDLLLEGFSQIIMGVEDIDYFDALVDSWKMAGGDEVTQAVNEMYGNK